MKKIYTTLVLLFAIAIAKAQVVSIPDTNFKAKLLSANASNQIASNDNINYYDNGTSESWEVAVGYNSIDINGDGEIQVSEAQTIKYLNISNSSISNLTGIEAFVNLEYLSCNNNSINNISNLSCTNLRYLNCNINLLTTINVTQFINLSTLECSNNQLTNINISQNLLLKRLNQSRLSLEDLQF